MGADPRASALIASVRRAASTIFIARDNELIADRIEAGTYAIAAAITGGHLELLNAPS